MRSLFIAALGALALLIQGPGGAVADDGCTNISGQWYCYPGAVPGIPFYGPRRRMVPFGEPDDGCTQRYGRWYCYRGARPGVPFYGPRPSASPAPPDDGCTQRQGYWYCYPGAHPGVPFYGRRNEGMYRYAPVD